MPSIHQGKQSLETRTQCFPWKNMDAFSPGRVLGSDVRTVEKRVDL